jgi:uncharacterized protein involved in exopolysaccharide biosynthesis
MVSLKENFEDDGLNTSRAKEFHERESGEIDLRLIVVSLWNKKWLIIVCILAFTVASVFYSLSLPDKYQSKAILFSSSSSGSSSLSKLAGQFGGLASLAGVNFGGGQSTDKVTIAIELMKTWGFLEELINKQKLEVEVYAVNGWDKLNNRLLINQELYDVSLGEWREDEKGVSLKPTSWALYKKLRASVSIFQDQKNRLITVSVEHYSPYEAKRIVDLLVEAINLHMQEQDKVESINSIEYLKKQIGSTDIAEMKSIFFQLIEEQTKTLMLTQISDGYVFNTLSQAKVTEEKLKPNRTIIVAISIVVGALFSFLLVFVIHLASKAKER